MSEFLCFLVAVYLLVVAARLAWSMLPFLLIAAVLFSCSGPDHRTPASATRSVSIEGGV